MRRSRAGSLAEATAVCADRRRRREFVTTPLKSSGDTLRLNFDVNRNGFIKVELIGQNGRTLDDCDTLWGNRLDAVVTWKGQSSLIGRPAARGGMTIRFRLRSAKLFSFQVV